MEERDAIDFDQFLEKHWNIKLNKEFDDENEKDDEIQENNDNIITSSMIKKRGRKPKLEE